MTTIEQKGIGTVIGTTRLAVPKHQRSFGWTAEEVSELLDDVDGAMARGQAEYFLGSVVVIGALGADRDEVLDGQQRLATVSLLLASIAEGFEQFGDGQAATAVRQLLSSYDIDQSLHSPHVRLNQYDDPFYRLLLASPDAKPAPGAPESHALMVGARGLTRGWVAKKTTENPAIALGWLKRVFKYLRDAVGVIYFRVPDDSNAYALFETLNDRGLDLSIADLLKNYLLGRAGADIDAVMALWVGTLGMLKSFGYEKNFTGFLRQYWASRYELVREKELYRHVKARISTQANVLEFADDLRKNSFYYTAMLSPDHEYWSGAQESTRERLKTLGVLGLEQYRPMLLAALAHFESKDVERVVAMLESWNVRLIIVGGLGGGVMEAHYASLGRAIRSGDIKNVKGLAEAALSFVPSDSEFGARFEAASVSKVPLARYYLRKLEVVAAGKAESEHVPNPSLTLEHILPEKPGTNYPQFSDDERRLFTRRLGNLALLTHKTNSDAKSAPFAEKRSVYKASTLILTQQIASFAGWSPEAVEARQKALAGLALKAWPLLLK
jgi:Protein of unknown function DUF262/Protein of unknown function (DUF1524)